MNAARGFIGGFSAVLGVVIILSMVAPSSSDCSHYEGIALVRETLFGAGCAAIIFAAGVLLINTAWKANNK